MQMLRMQASGGEQGSYRRPARNFATLDAGAPKTLGVYFMYDVKQVTPRNSRRHRGMLRSWISRE